MDKLSREEVKELVEKISYGMDCIFRQRKPISSWLNSPCWEPLGMDKKVPKSILQMVSLLQ